MILLQITGYLIKKWKRNKGGTAENLCLLSSIHILVFIIIIVVITGVLIVIINIILKSKGAELRVCARGQRATAIEARSGVLRNWVF